MIEEFRDIPGYEGLYQVSNTGKIYSLKTNKFLKQRTSVKGYCLISLNIKSKKRNETVHRLVMLSFVGPSKLHVNHINGIKTDNRLENLEYCTAKENNEHAFRTGLNISQKGEQHGMSKLKNTDIVEIKKLLKTDLRQVDIARMFNVTRHTVCDIKREKIWKHIKCE